MTPKHYFSIFAITAVYAVIDELLQIPVGRNADVYDALADGAGSLIGLATLFATRHIIAQWWRSSLDQ